MAAALLPMLCLAVPAAAQSVRATLSKKPWTAVRVKGADLVAEKPATIVFEPSGRLTGSGGCNRLMGKYTLAGNGSSVRIEQVSSTRLLCPQSVMRAERALISALETAKAISADRNGRLVLHRDDDILAVFK